MNTQPVFTPSPLAGFVAVHLNDLDGPALDWAVAKAAGIDIKIVPPVHKEVARIFCVTPHGFGSFRPSSDWADAGPLLREFQVALTPEAHYGAEGTETSERWIANIYYAAGEQYTTEPCRNELVALCRAIVVTKFGETIHVPVELMLSDSSGGEGAAVA
ncbi:DUF2591 family protein [Pseudomonas sp. P66]|uniref:DUF2591 family protein n=1 Tax=Pseudomonas arcuscaelestis TaxID=2710591 RepID=A0ABS2C0H3_9PSED|nr:phage protein NinX family protein [Pseudomonas arcuscaelestis]MBM5458736.1 DUF2591 family protein [Pseudomonas arcuscaelestis]